MTLLKRDRDDEEATDWIYDIGDKLEVFYVGDWNAWFAGTVTEQKVQNGRAAYRIQHDEEDKSYTWAYSDKDEIRVMGAGAEQATSDDDVHEMECDGFSSADDDVPLAQMKKLHMHVHVSPRVSRRVGCNNSYPVLVTHNH